MGLQELLHACDRFLDYPKNTVQDDVLQHNLYAYSNRLQQQLFRLFVGEEKAALDFLDLNGGQKGAACEFRPARVQSLGDLNAQLREAFREGNSEPLCRFIFIHAYHSRAPLNISFEMFCFLFSYLQVMPSFLDFVFPFGDQEHAQDFYFTGFREEILLERSHQCSPIHELGRSGRHMRLCYNLRSVEESTGDLPWSIRQTAVYQTFDFETGKSVWITIKGNNLIKKRISNLMNSFDCTTLNSVEGSFKISLQALHLLCDWSVEGWRWYINELEQSFRGLTGNSLATTVDRPPSPIVHESIGVPPSASVVGSILTPKEPFPTLSRRGTLASFISPSQRQRSFSIASLKPTRTCTDLSMAQTATDEVEQQHWWEPRGRSFQHGLKQGILLSRQKLSAITHWRGRDHESCDSNEKLGESVMSADLPQEPPQMPPGMTENDELHTGQKIDFSRLQRIQYIEEKAHEVSLVLRLNIEILRELVSHYSRLAEYPEFPDTIKENCGSDIERFKRFVKRAEQELQLQRSRTDTLLRVIAERKTFLYGILQYQSMRSSEAFAKKAHESAMKMEVLTHNMNDLAQKTKQETVSMRIITLVTLFFLPGTFIATFMSTDIIKYTGDNERHFQSSALKLFLGICIPLMVVTFLSWYIVYRSVENSRKHNPSATVGTGYSANV